MLDFLTQILQILKEDKRIIFTLVLFIAYFLYLKKYRYYIFKQKKHFTRGKHPIGKTIPNYPNGWFRILSSSELKEKEVKYVNAHGESLAVFRGEDKIVYALDAYCAHLGANLGVEGNVVNTRCIQCPFHAWTFDGKTGNCVVGKDMKPKEAFRYEYDFSSSSCGEAGAEVTNENEIFSKKNKKNNNTNFKENNNNNSNDDNNAHENCSFTQGKKEIVKIRKFQVIEKSGSIFVWFHASDFLKYNETGENTEYTEFPYEPFDLSEYDKKLEYRGTSLNTVATHVQDVAENGGDLLHFLYIHNQLIPYLVKGFWDAKWIRGSDPELRSKLKLSKENYNSWRNTLLDKYLTEKKCA